VFFLRIPLREGNLKKSPLEKGARGL